VNDKQQSLFEEHHGPEGRSVKVSDAFGKPSPAWRQATQNFRTDGPDTSRATGIQAEASGMAGGHREMILGVLRAAGEGMTSGEIALACVLARHRVMKRMNELKIAAAQEQARVIRNNRGVVPLDLDDKLMSFVNQYPFFSESERKQIESMTGIRANPIIQNRPSLDELRAKHLR